MATTEAMEAAIPQDTVRTAIEGKTEAVHMAMEQLCVALIEDALFVRLAKTNVPLEREASLEQAKAAKLRESYAALRPRVEAKLRLLALACDESAAEGRDDEAEAKRSEALGLEENLRNIQSEANRCSAKVAELDQQRSRNSAIVFSEGYRDARLATVAVSTAVAVLLDRTWSGFCQFEKENMLPLNALARLARRDGLTPNDYGSEKKSFFSLKRWFGGRIR